MTLAAPTPARRFCGGRTHYLLCFQQLSRASWRAPESAEIVNYYRIPETYADFRLSGELPKEAGYFRFGSDTICYSHFIGRTSASVNDPKLDGALQCVRMEGSSCLLPFNPTHVFTNLRYERYLNGALAEGKQTTLKKLIRKTYYLLHHCSPSYCASICSVPG